jgi:NAD(P)-dependent dehydrogenase (short-subunit alcohol dehydrogenase family)
MSAALRSGTVAVVTGGARGIGLAVVDALLAEGVGVACLDQVGADYSDFEEHCSASGLPHLVAPVDVRDRDGMFEAVRAASGLGEVAYAVNCAGIDSLQSSEQVDAQAFERVVDVDLNGIFYSCQAEYAVMRGSGGAIVNIASMSGHIINRGIPAHPAYSAAKAGVIHLTKQLAVEWVADNVRLNSVSPGYVMTEMTRRNGPEMNATFAEHTPMGRLADVTEIAAPVVFLLGAGASYITGADLLVDGGFTVW